jgi:hypothetical protein
MKWYIINDDLSVYLCTGKKKTKKVLPKTLIQAIEYYGERQRNKVVRKIKDTLEKI